MAQVKLTENIDKLFAQNGKKYPVFEQRQLTINSIDYIGNDNRGGAYESNFVETLVCEEYEVGKPKWSVAFFDKPHLLKENLEGMKRGDIVNAELGLSIDGANTYQNIKFIAKASPDEVYTPPQSEEPQEEVGIPEEPKVEEVSEDVHLPPEAEFRFAIPYHDRKNLSIQRQQAVKFALEYVDIMAKNDLGIDEEVSEFIWNGIQELWKDIPREVNSSEK